MATNEVLLALTQTVSDSTLPDMSRDGTANTKRIFLRFIKSSSVLRAAISVTRTRTRYALIYAIVISILKTKTCSFS